MDQLFRRLPLSFKLILIGVIPLAFIIYLTWQVYEEKSKNISLIEGYISRVNQIGDLTTLIRELQQEQKLSFDVLKKNAAPKPLVNLRKATDSILTKLRLSNDFVLKGFEEYTSLHNLNGTRNKMDSGLLNADGITHFYSNTIFRLNTLTSTPYGNQTILQPFYSDIQSQKLLTEITTYLGIIRTNIYNVLTTRQYMVETLMGTVGAYDVYKSYDTELKYKASRESLEGYTHIRNNTDLKPTVEYIDKLFTTFKFDSTYSAEQWWTVSENGLDRLSELQQAIWKSVNKNIDLLYKEEIAKKKNTLILLILITAVVVFIIAYTITIITTMLSELKHGAEKIAGGGSGLEFDIDSKDAIGSLAESIWKIDENNRQLTSAADEIGKGNFMVAVNPRSDEDLLAKALLRMKQNLQFSIKALEESEAQFKQLADLMPQIVWTTNGNGKTDYLNKQWYEYAGNIEPEKVIHPDDAEITANTWAKAVSKGEGFIVENRMLNHLTKQYRWFLVRASPIKDAEGKITKWFGTSTDIHERKSMSEELEKLVQQRTLELKRSNDDLLQFAHVASHDMKEPLRKVNFFSDRLIKEVGDQLSEKARSYLSKINNAAQRLMAMIEGVLEFPTINNDGRAFETVDLNQTIEGIVNDLEMTIQQKKADINWANLPVIKGVPILIHQLFYNLVVNALKFSKDDMPPVITISARRVKHEADSPNSLHNDNNYLGILIEDNGIGISESMSNKVFDVFARVHGRDKYEGTGLGLALCKKIMERHKGWICVKSEEGKGSVFHIVLPESLVVKYGNVSVGSMKTV